MSDSSTPAAGASYWRELLAGRPPALQLPADAVRTPGGTRAPERHSFQLDADALASLAGLGDDADAPLLAAWAATIARLTGQHDLLLATPLPVRLDLTGDPSFRELAARVATALAGTRANADVALDDVLVAEGVTAATLLQAGFARGGADWTAAGAFDQLEATLVIADDGAASLELDATLFGADTARRTIGHLTTLLVGAAAAPDTTLAALPLLTDDERKQILLDWNDTAIDFPRDVCLHELFEAAADATPDAVAIVHGDRRWTYREVDETANRLAHHLRGLGVGPDSVVGICVDRSEWIPIGLLAIAKAGGAYLPMDPAYPRERLAYLVTDSRVQVLVTQRHLGDALPASDASVVYVDADRDAWSAHEPTRPTDVGVTADHLAYVIYTSGSTGAPKGVLLNHRGRVNNFLDFNRRFAVGAGDALIALASLSFDMCAYDMFGTLAAGATIVMPASGDMQDPATWARLMREHKVTTWHTAPAMLKMLVDHLELNPDQTPAALRLVLLGGDWIPVSLPDRLRALKDGVQVISMGGATECSMDSTIYEVREVDPAWTSIPYGEPMKNQLAYVLDPNGQLLPVGVPGELFLGGIGVGRGYFERPELTAERFLPNPFESTLDDPEPRMYRTGDLARWMPDGNLELLGRIDNQVKIRGYRIELGEIESRINEHAGVREGVVVAREDAAGEKRLVAYLVQDADWQGSDEDQESLGGEQVEQWQAVYDNAYSKTEDDVDPTFNIVSWDSSYTSEAIPAEQMKLWVEQTVDRIAATGPDRVLEIGCGMGLLLFRLAPNCSYYLGTDFSKVALDFVGKHAERLEMPQVHLESRWADNFDGIEDDSLDCIVLNSIILDFPSMEYLQQVLEGSARAVKPGGAIFVGDVRSGPLLEVYQSSVQLFQAPDDLSQEQLSARVRRLIRQEEELVIDPAYFLWLREKLDEIGRVKIQLKRGSFTNELNAFRYDVTLFVGDSATAPTATPTWLDWEDDGLDLDALRARLADDAPEYLCVRGVLNQRVERDVRTVELLATGDGTGTAGELRAALGDARGVNPEDVWALGADLPYEIDLRWSADTAGGRFDVAFLRVEDGGEVPDVLFPADGAGEHPVDVASEPRQFANNPMMGKLSRQLGPELRRHLEARLPEYMVPAVFVPLDAMPLSPNGKVDRKRLPEPDTSRPDLDSPYVAPRDPVEEVLAAFWTDVLALDRVGINDAFLDLGGHSLLAVQIRARMNDVFPFTTSLPDIFDSRTVARLAEVVRAKGSQAGVDSEEVCRTFLVISSMSDDEVAQQLARAGE
jgi:amino acid adenylation domain-containing protein